MDPAARAAIKAKLEKITLPLADFNGKTITEAVELLNALAKTHDPAKGGVPIVLDLSVVPQQIGLPQGGKTPAVGRLQKVSLADALDIFVRLNNLRWVISPDKILVVPITVKTPFD
jgi:hypothetical protein